MGHLPWHGPLSIMRFRIVLASASVGRVPMPHKSASQLPACRRAIEIPVAPTFFRRSTDVLLGIPVFQEASGLMPPLAMPSVLMHVVIVFKTEGQMVKLINPLSTGDLAACSDGCLVAIPERGGVPDYAIIIKHLEEGLVLLAVIKSSQQEIRPHFSRIHGINDCVSFGVDWCFEIVPPKNGEAFADSDVKYESGAVVIDGQTALLRLGRGPHNTGFSPGYIDLSTLRTAGNPSHNSVAVRKWRVWANESEVGKLGAVPLFEQTT